MPGHFPNLDFLIGPWGDESTNDRKLVAWLYNPALMSFVAIDSDSRPTAKSPLCSEPLTRAEVLGDSALKAIATQLLDAVWLGDPRVQEVRELASTA